MAAGRGPRAGRLAGAALLVVLGIASASVTKCPGVCSVPRDEKFCGSLIPFDACPVSSFAAQDLQARDVLENLLNNFSGIASECKDTLKNVVCRRFFSACEEEAVLPVCTESCSQTVLEQCPENKKAARATNYHKGSPTGFPDDSLITEMLASTLSEEVCTLPGAVPQAEDESCVQLDYRGPNPWQWIAGFLIATFW